MKNLLVICMTLASATCLAISNNWRLPSADNLVYLQLESGTVVIELAPFIAPKHVTQFKQLVEEGFYNGLDFYRVIDGFVAQAGDYSEQQESEHKQPLQSEFMRTAPKDSPFFVVESQAMFEPENGLLYGFAAGRDVDTKQEWLLHCPGIIAMARSNDKDSATTDFYITIGQGPRHLDRNMSVFGRVIWGMQHIQSVNRGDPEKSGVIEDSEQRSKILWASLGTDTPAGQQLPIQIQNEWGNTYQQWLQGKRDMQEDFFHYKGNGKVDICYRGVNSRLAPESTD
ncbi:peptidylprolyl isomerase [Alteromonadaceae bacterium BrNp21-10]|nr:peptidylprolyl isomerase [Alteromonadaceae bacterium BrNp21-10]